MLLNSRDELGNKCMNEWMYSILFYADNETLTAIKNNIFDIRLKRGKAGNRHCE